MNAEVVKNRGYTDREVADLPFFVEWQVVKTVTETITEIVDGKEKKRKETKQVIGKPMLSRYPSANDAAPWLAKVGERGWRVINQNVVKEEV